ncbi:MAG: lysophospholipid acyltransferase family protein [Dongiaceae bacterium]
MRQYKKWLQQTWVQEMAAFAASLYIRLVYLTSSWKFINAHVPQNYWDQGKPFILCFWHNRLLLMPHSWRSKQKMRMLISAHRDGQLISRTIAHFGLETIAGSSSKGGQQAFRQMAKSLKQGESVGITPDGPRGPRQRASLGAVQLAMLSGAALIPVTVATSKRKLLRSWDRFVINLPFSQGVYYWGEPIQLGKDDDIEALRQRLEAALNIISAEADQLCGQAPIPPAEIELQTAA